MTDWADLLHATADHATHYLDHVDERPVGPPIEPATLRQCRDPPFVESRTLS